MSTYIKYRYCGWIDNIPEITVGGTYSINPITSSNNNFFKIPIKNSDEYLFVEFRVNTGFFESQLPDRGLIIYRINEKYWGNDYTKPETPGGTYDQVYAFRLGGSMHRKGEHLKANFSANHNRREFNNITDPFCFVSNGSTCGVAIKNIGAATGPKMTFTVDFCDTGDVFYDYATQIPPYTNAPNITTTGDIIIETDILTFEASQQVLINGNFEVKSGSIFSAIINDCE